RTAYVRCASISVVGGRALARCGRVAALTAALTAAPGPPAPASARGAGALRRGLTLRSGRRRRRGLTLDRASATRTRPVAVAAGTLARALAVATPGPATVAAALAAGLRLGRLLRDDPPLGALRDALVGEQVRGGRVGLDRLVE